VQVRALSFAEKRDWLRLSRTPRVGPVAFRDLLVRYKTAGAALEALPSIMRRKASDIPPVEAIEAEMEQSEQMGVQILAACEADYPVYLRAVDPNIGAAWRGGLYGCVWPRARHRCQRP